jgi:hypothetical protein
LLTRIPLGKPISFFPSSLAPMDNDHYSTEEDHQTDLKDLTEEQISELPVITLNPMPVVHAKTTRWPPPKEYKTSFSNGQFTTLMAKETLRQKNGKIRGKSRKLDEYLESAADRTSVLGRSKRHLAKMTKNMIERYSCFTMFVFCSHGRAIHHIGCGAHSIALSDPETILPCAEVLLQDQREFFDALEKGNYVPMVPPQKPKPKRGCRAGLENFKYTCFYSMVKLYNTAATPGFMVMVDSAHADISVFATGDHTLKFIRDEKNVASIVAALIQDQEDHWNSRPDAKDEALARVADESVGPIR